MPKYFYPNDVYNISTRVYDCNFATEILKLCNKHNIKKSMLKTKCANTKYQELLKYVII